MSEGWLSGGLGFFFMKAGKEVKASLEDLFQVYSFGVLQLDKDNKRRHRGLVCAVSGNSQ